MNEKLENLINEVNLFNQIRDLKIEKSEEQFNMFRICGVDHYENTHSAIIAELLNPNGSHNYKTKFLEAFINTLEQHTSVKDDEFIFDYKNATVKTEHSTAFGRIDIFITNHKQALIIENKIYAGEQFQQLKRYYEYGEVEFGNNFKLLYLTLQGDESGDETSRDLSYITVSYSEFILEWVNRCIEISARSHTVRETLIQYGNHIKSLTNNNAESNMNKELIEKLSHPDNLDAVFTIGQNFSNVKNHIIETILLDQLEDVASELNLVFKRKKENHNYVNTSWSGFVFENPKFSNYNLFTEFGAKGLRRLIIGYSPKAKDIDNRALPELKKIMGGGNQRCAYKKFPKYQNWEKEAMKAILSGEMKELFRNELKNLIQLAENTDGI